MDRNEQPLPVVLAGGRSSRFGRNKLLEPLEGGGVLVDRPISALRAVFGDPVALAGDCEAALREKATLVIPDSRLGCGPVGGIVAALLHPRALAGVFILAGDLPCITPEDVRAIWLASAAHPGAAGVLAWSGAPEPCIGLYRPAARPRLESRCASGRRSLHDAFAGDEVAFVPIPAAHARNINTAGDLEGTR